MPRILIQSRRGNTLAKLLGPGHICAWPGFGDWTDDPENIDDWIVGMPTRVLGGSTYLISPGDACPSCYIEIATVKNRTLAIAMAAHLNAIPRR